MRVLEAGAPKAVGAGDECLTLGPGVACLLGHDDRKPWNCLVCQAILRWARKGYPLIMVRELAREEGLFLFPAINAEEEPGFLDCLLQMRVLELSVEDIRLTVNTLLGASENVWVLQEEQPARCERIR